jgi:hypothetical protein
MEIEELEKINRVAFHNISDSFVPNLMQLLGYRQRVAQEIIKSDGNERIHDLYNYTNGNIKKLLDI